VKTEQHQTLKDFNTSRSFPEVLDVQSFNTLCYQRMGKSYDTHCSRLWLTLRYQCAKFLTYPVHINITLLPCPLGFMLHNSQHKCVCHLQLEEHNIACNISDQTVHRSGNMWLNSSFLGNTTNGVIIHSYCPFGYCKHREMNIKLENADIQCAFNRAGILCGGCQKGLSLALGSSQCLSCSNTYLTLLIPLTIAGFMLVFFLTFLNLTVSQGTTNGLIFYANIVKVNEATTVCNHSHNLEVT